MAKRPVEKYDFKAFGEAIKAARTERKESRKKVSDEMFISPRYLANIENKGQHPSLQIFFELMLRYDISVDQFLLEKPDTKNTQRRQNCLLGSVPNPRNGKERQSMDGRKRTVQIKFRVTEAERDLILEKMKLIPTRNMAAYLRKIAIDGYIVQVDHTDIKAMTAEIQKIGVNVNQIAKRVNSTGSVYQEDIEEIKGVLAEIWRLQRLSLLRER